MFGVLCLGQWATSASSSSATGNVRRGQAAGYRGEVVQGVVQSAAERMPCVQDFHARS